MNNPHFYTDPFWLVMILYSTYLGFTARGDGREVHKGESIDHELNWFFKVVVSLIIGVTIGKMQLISIISLVVFLIPWTWILTDIFTNGHLKKNLITYMGSSRTDNWFKYHFGTRALLTMWATKIILLLLTSFLMFLRYQSII